MYVVCRGGTSMYVACRGVLVCMWYVGGTSMYDCTWYTFGAGEGIGSVGIARGGDAILYSMLKFRPWFALTLCNLLGIPLFIR